MSSSRKIAAGLTILLLTSSGFAYERNDSRLDGSRTLARDQALGLYSAQQRKPTFESCSDLFPQNNPISLTRFPAGMQPLALCSDHFAVVYSRTSKTPLVVIERLTAQQLRSAKGEERTNQFFPDPRIPKSGRSELSDYRSQIPPVDRGHQAPAADAPSPRAMAQSFALSNMVPKDPTLNRKVWSKIETDVRKFAQRSRGNVYVFTGPIFGPGHVTVGANKVWKPTHLFKLVYDEPSSRAWAYLQVNSETHIERPMDYPTFIAKTGLNFLEGLPINGSITRQ